MRHGRRKVAAAVQMPTVPSGVVSAAELRARLIPRRIPDSEIYRRYYGRGLDMSVIEAALRMSEVGLMSDLTDLENESASLDPHVLSTLAKRFGTAASFDWAVTPRAGNSVPRKEAQRVADACEQALRRIPYFGERIYEMAWALFHGRAACEIHWSQRPGLVPWTPAALEWVHPRRLSYGPDRELRLVDTWQKRGYFQRDGFALEEFPGKFVAWSPRLFATYPEQEGIGPRTLYWCFFKRFSWRMRMALTELFGIPWRIVSFDKDAPVNPEAVKAAHDQAEKLGGETTASLGRGAKLDVVFPGENSGELFGMTNEDVDKQMSKLVLGNTGTTEGNEANRANAIINKGEQEILAQLDANSLSARFTQQLLRPFVELNFGPGAWEDLGPSFAILSAPQRDRDKDVERIGKVLSFGLPVAVAEARELAGLRDPAPDEEVLDKPPAPPPGAPGTQIVDKPEQDGGAGAADAAEGDMTVTAARAALELAGVRLSEHAERALRSFSAVGRARFVERVLEGRDAADD